MFFLSFHQNSGEKPHGKSKNSSKLSNEKFLTSKHFFSNPQNVQFVANALQQAVISTTTE